MRTLLGSSPFPFGIPRSDGTFRSYIEVGPKKGTAVPLPARRLGLTPTIPFTAALKPLTVCDSIYAKPVKSAAITPQLCGKRKPIPFLYASYLRSRAVRPVREAAEGKVGVQRGRETVGVPPFLRPPRVRPVPAVRRRRNSPARQRRIAPQLGCTGKRLLGKYELFVKSIDIAKTRCIIC